MSWIPAALIVGFLIWLWSDLIHTPVTEDPEQDRDITDRIYDDKYDQ